MNFTLSYVLERRRASRGLLSAARPAATGAPANSPQLVLYRGTRQRSGGEAGSGG